jgi:hypothetical protein
MKRTFLAALGASLCIAAPAAAQRTGAQQAGGVGPVIDTIIVTTWDVYDPAEAEGSAIYRVANAVRIHTRPYIVRRELLFQQGEPYDSAQVAESARNLRALGVFRWVGIDTLRVDGRFAVHVHTADGWSTQLVLNGRVTAGRFTWAVGLTETNFLGTANRVSAIYYQEVDRTAWRFAGRFNRLFGTQLQATGGFEDLSDGTRGEWRFGLPFRALQDRHAFEIYGEAADQRILQYRVPRAVVTDTTRFQRRALILGAEGAVAPIASTAGYLRLGLRGRVRREEFIGVADTGTVVPDSVTGAVGVFGELLRARFKVVTHFNGFGHQEDLDLSTRIRLALWAAPAEFGYERSGVGPAVRIATGASFPSGYMTLQGVANGLFTSAGLDSGQVRAELTVGAQLIRHHATFFHVQGGIAEMLTPGQEYDLGHGVGPRIFGAHAFVGDRSLWGTLEHRWFAWDELLGNLGIGFAAFVDYGGAWYEDQPARIGGNVGLGLRFGFSRASGANVGGVDVGYRFGDGWDGNRWAVSVARGFLF